MSLAHRVFRFLGDVSYGIYVLHPFVCFAVVRLIKPHWLELGTVAGTFLCHGVSLAMTIAAASASWILIERPILRWKSRFTVVPSGPATGRP